MKGKVSKSKKKKSPKYQFAMGNRVIHIEAKNQKLAEKKASRWHKKNAPNTILAYDYRVD
jgi:hypothetical protein